MQYYFLCVAGPQEYTYQTALTRIREAAASTYAVRQARRCRPLAFAQSGRVAHAVLERDSSATTAPIVICFLFAGMFLLSSRSHLSSGPPSYVYTLQFASGMSVVQFFVEKREKGEKLVLKSMQFIV